MEWETTASCHAGSTEPVWWSCIVTVDHWQLFDGSGPTEDAAIIDALVKASEEHVEARAELRIRLGLRGDGRGGRPLGT